MYFNDFFEDIKSVILNVKYLLFDTNQISDIGVRKNMSENKILYYAIELIKIRQKIRNIEEAKRKILEIGG